ncbi:hypothetical protein GTU79_15435 [Sodalis ligni]|uniref:hypothetical protein n=1 Tax=Sodalis ligni TaxID=2697027 RepID=UPI001BDE0FF8|nr:hypothetical protein [Sodalis ligni]QWA08927.1 hypothetical protein GTU79_15435 [Sodalis ligni]
MLSILINLMQAIKVLMINLLNMMQKTGSAFKETLTGIKTHQMNFVKARVMKMIFLAI